MSEASKQPEPKTRKTRRCNNCGNEFVPYDSYQRFCGDSQECSKAEQEAEREAYEDRRESAERDDYGRY